MATFTEIAKALKSRGENSRNDFQTPTRRERDEENVEETNNEQGDEGSPLSSGDGDRGNALRFHEYMVMNGHMFYMCNGRLLWYKPDIGYYLEEDRACLFELRGLIGRCGCIEADYQQSTSKQGAMITQFKSIVPKEDDFYDLAGKNTFRKLAFYNGVFDFEKQELLDFSPEYFFTFKAPVDFKCPLRTTVREVKEKLFYDIFGNEKGEFFMKVVARALAGEVADKRFIVALGKTNSGKGTLTEMLNNCFGLNKFIGNYDGRNLSSTGTRTLSWLYTNRNSRIILANEVDKNRAIDANVLKMCANGGEPITATAKYMNEASFVPQGTMFLFANKMPHIKGADDGSGAVENRMVYVETEYSYLNEDDPEYEKKKDTDGVRKADPTLKTEYLKREEVKEAFAYLVCMAYDKERPKAPEAVKKKALEYKPDVPLDTLIDDLVSFTGNNKDYIVFSQLMTKLSGVASANKTSVGTLMRNRGYESLDKNIKRLGTKRVYIGLVWKDTSGDTTTTYEDGEETSEVSTAFTSTPELTKLIEERQKLIATDLGLDEMRKEKEKFEDENLQLLKTRAEEQEAHMRTINDLTETEHKLKDMIDLLRRVEMKHNKQGEYLDEDGNIRPEILAKHRDTRLVDKSDND